MLDAMIYAVVLAGGRSTRMGRDKRFLEMSGEPFVDRAIRLATAAVGGKFDRVLLCGDVPHRNSLPDSTVGLGPLGGLLTAVEHVRLKSMTQGHWLLVLPVDMPLMNVSLLDALVSAAADSADTWGSCAVASYEEYEMPFLLRVDQCTHASLNETISNTKSSLRSIRAFHRRVGVRHINRATAQPQQLMNVNYPQDWETAQKVDRDEHSL